MLKTTLYIAIALTLAVAGHAFAIGGWTSEARADCPGKIECPLTGEIVCRDQCPVNDPDRPDCPGKIECPDTGEYVCADRCPADRLETTGTARTPSCCSDN